MKFLMIHGTLILHCCLLSIYCLPIKEDKSLGHPKKNRKMRVMEKTDEHDPECDLQLNEMDIRETIKNEPDPKTKAESVWEDNLSPKAESKIIASKELLKGVPHLMERMATTASPVTELPHGYLYPGTKWCGRGNIAASDDDLGTEEETDKCCRSHDKCPDHILAGETKYNLTNHTPYTSMSCKCDKAFYECLRRANTTTSNSIGGIYFNLAAKDCFALDYPKKCKRIVPIFKSCYEFEVDTSAGMFYQWIKPIKFNKL